MNHCSVCAHKHKKDCIWNCGCEAFELDLADHDKQIRDEVIGEFVERVEKENINIYEQPINCVRKVAMQMKGDQNE